MQVPSNDLVKLRLEGLLDEAKKGASYGYIVARLREILGGTKWEWAIKVADKITTDSAMVKFAYNIYLVVNGLSLRGVR